MVLMGCGTVSDSTDGKKEVAIEQHNNKETQEAIPSIGNVTQSNQVTEEAATEELPEEYECGLIVKYIVRRHITGGENCTLISAETPPRLCRTGN